MLLLFDGSWPCPLGIVWPFGMSTIELGFLGKKCVWIVVDFDGWFGHGGSAVVLAGGGFVLYQFSLLSLAGDGIGGGKHLFGGYCL